MNIQAQLEVGNAIKAIMGATWVQILANNCWISEVIPEAKRRRLTFVDEVSAKNILNFIEECLPDDMDYDVHVAITEDQFIGLWHTANGESNLTHGHYKVSQTMVIFNFQ